MTSFFGDQRVAPVFVGNENAWNSFCIQVNGTAAMMKLNGRNLITQEDSFNRTSFWDVTTLSKFNSTRFWDITTHTQSKHNKTVFWKFSSQSNSKTSFPFQPSKGGAIKDVNIWDTMLSQEELEEWMGCIQLQGNVFSWQNSSHQIQLEGLKLVSNDSLHTKCHQPEIIRYIVGNVPLNFEETFNFCSKLGSMAVISSKEIALGVNRTLASYKTKHNGIWMNTFPDLEVYTGYTDIEKEGDWVIHDTDKKLDWPNWSPGEPKSSGDDEDCAKMDTSTFLISGVPCTRKLFPVCELSKVPNISFVQMKHDMMMNIALQQYQWSGLSEGGMIDTLFTPR